MNQSTRERRGGVKSLSLKNNVNLKDSTSLSAFLIFLDSNAFLKRDKISKTAFLSIIVEYYFGCFYVIISLFQPLLRTFSH